MAESPSYFDDTATPGTLLNFTRTISRYDIVFGSSLCTDGSKLPRLRSEGV